MCRGCISYTLSPVHTNEAFAKYAKTLEEMGADSICIKDMAGLLTPYTCYELVRELKAAVKIPVDIHSHYTAGLASHVHHQGHRGRRRHCGLPP